MLETGKIRHVPPPETSSCTTCGARYTGEGGPEFVSFDNNGNDAEDVPAGLIETAERREGYVAYRVRDPYRGGGSTSITVALMQQCSDCIRQAGELLGKSPTRRRCARSSSCASSGSPSSRASSSARRPTGSRPRPRCGKPPSMSGS